MSTTLPRAARVVGTVTAALALTLTTAVTASAAPAPTQAPAAVRAAGGGDVGLFGSADPSFDGVFRQGLAITGLRAVKAALPTSAITRSPGW